jgi:hypothetical protein
MKIKATYDKLINTEVKDTDGKLIRVVKTHHFIFGKRGKDEIGGGFYIPAGKEIPKEIVIDVPDID